MSRTKDYFTMYEDPTYDDDGTCQDSDPADLDTGSVAFAQMIEQLTQKPELEFDWDK